jgi:hypothetical protein
MIVRREGFVTAVGFWGLVIGFVVISLSAAKGTTIKAASPSFKDVSTAVASASDGDTVIVPAGTASWNATLAVAKGITIQGATTITGTRDNPTVADGTIVLDDVARTSTASAMVKATVALGKSFRLSGFTFRRGSLTTNAENAGVRLTGTSQAMRVDHCHFDGLRQNPNIGSAGWVYGVVDHCVFDLNVSGAESFQIFHNEWGGQIFGNGSWADDSYFGSEKFLFIEDCTFNRTAGGGLDCYNGGRYVARYNRFNNMGTQSHGTETGGRERSARAIEVYNNTFNWTAGPVRAGELRGGCLLTHDNVWTGMLRAENGISLNCYRLYYPFTVWGAANGANTLDSNDPKGVYLSGTAGTGSGTNTLVVRAAGWIANQWVGYTAINTTKIFSTGCGSGQHPSSWIMSNTSDTIKVKSDNNTDGPDVSFIAGDTFQIRKVLVALDQPGRGKGGLITASNPLVSGVSWPNQALDPVYSWNNKRATDNSDVLLGSVSPTVKEGRDFYNNTPKPGYTPYKYPHPLTGLAPPSDLSIVTGP